MTRPAQEPHLSQLQDKILRMVCTKQNVDYTLLTKETNRDRVTIAQSVNSLVERDYVTKDKMDPEYEKSKVIVNATFLGKDYSVNVLKVNLEDILKAEDDKQISAFLEFIEDLPHSQRQELIDPLKELFSWLHDVWTDHVAMGKVSNKQSWKDELTKQSNKIIKNELIHGLKTGISQLVRDENYDANKLLNKRSIESLRKLLTSTEIKELRQFIMQLKDNIISTAEKFPQ